MIITLKGANFESNRIGVLSKWNITRVLDAGTTYDGPTSVDKGAEFSATLTLKENYEYLAGISVTMSGDGTINKVTNGNVTTITSSNVTGNITIRALTKDVTVITPTTYTFTINPTPANATVTMNGIVQNSITVAQGTTINWSVAADGYESQSGTHVVSDNHTMNVTLTETEIAPTTYTVTYVYVDGSGAAVKDSETETVTAGTVMNFATTDSRATVDGYTCTAVSQASATINSNITVTYTYTANEIPEGTNLITLGTAHTDKKLGSSSSTPTSGTGYTVYSDIPVTAGNVYAFTSCFRSWWLNADKEDLSSFNPGTSSVIAPVNAAYVSVTTQTESEPSIVLYYDTSSTERPEGDDILTQGTAHTGKALSSTSYEMTDNEVYTVYDQIPVEAGAVYKVNNGFRIWWLKEDKTGLMTVNASTTAGVVTAPTDAAYVSVTLQTGKLSDAYMIKLV